MLGRPRLSAPAACPSPLWAGKGVPEGSGGGGVDGGSGCAGLAPSSSGLSLRRRGGWGGGAEPGAGGARGWGALACPLWTVSRCPLPCLEVDSPRPALCGPCLVPLPLPGGGQPCAPSAGAPRARSQPHLCAPAGWPVLSREETGRPQRPQWGPGGGDPLLWGCPCPTVWLSRRFCCRCRPVPREGSRAGVTGSLFSTQGEPRSSEASEGSGPQSRGRSEACCRPPGPR